MNTPDVEGGGSLLLAWQVKGRHCLVVGGGEVAAGRINLLLVADAKVTVIAPSITAEIQHYYDSGRLHALHLREYSQTDLTIYETESLNSSEKLTIDKIDETDFSEIDNRIRNEIFSIVCVAIDDHKLSKLIYYQAKIKNLQVNIADKPPICDYYFGAMYRNGPLQIMVSTNGKSPRLAKIIKDKIRDNFKDIKMDKSIENLGSLRSKLRTKVPGENLDSISSRMEWVKKVTDSYSLEDWSNDLDDTLIDRILDYYPEYPPSDKHLVSL